MIEKRQHRGDEPTLISNKKEWNRLLEQEKPSKIWGNNEPLNYPCFVYYYQDYSDAFGNELECYFFYPYHARALLEEQSINRSWVL